MHLSSLSVSLWMEGLGCRPERDDGDYAQCHTLFNHSIVDVLAWIQVQAESTYREGNGAVLARTTQCLSDNSSIARTMDTLATGEGR